jgi:stage III sporulation protein AE
MTILTAVLLFQNILASSADTVAARTVKFTVTSFIPVVGGMIGDVSRTIIGSIQAVKSITGIFGVLVILVTLLPPLITVILNKFMLKISGAFALILGLDRQSEFLKEMNSLLDITVAIMVAASIVFIFDITLFVRTAVSF